MIRRLAMAGLLGALLLVPGTALLHGQGQPPHPMAGDSSVRILFFDVGQGDAALVISPTGKKILIDAGPAPRVVAERLHALHIDTLDLVVASHNHADHIGGMAAVLSSIVVRNYLENGEPATTQTYAGIIRVLEARHIPVLRAVPRRIDLGGGATARVLVGPAGASTQNNRSVGIIIGYGAFEALFTGDAEDAERAFWEDSAAIGRVEVLKVAHHGSINGTDPRFVAAIKPCIAVISVGDPNKFGHPSLRTLSLLRASGTTIFRTDHDGEISVAARRDGAVIVNRSAARTGEVRPVCASTLPARR